MNDLDDARIIYDDTRIFTRGRSPYKPDPHPQNDTLRIAGNIAVWIVLPAAVWAAIVVAVIHAMMPVAR